MKLAYLISRYPAISHTFILREVAELRRQGFDILIASINAPDRPESGLTAEERSDARETFYVKAAGIPGATVALARTLVSHPLGVIKGLRLVLRLGGTDLRRLAKSLAYLVEGLMIGQWMARHQVSHLHVHFATPAASVGLMTQAVFGIRFSFTVHGPDEFYDAPGQGLTAKIEGADFVVCISHYARSQMMKLSGVEHWDKFEVCRLGVDPEIFMPAERVAEPGPFRLVCVGRLVSAKGQHILLQALHQLAESGRFPHMDMVGDGPDRSSLVAEAGRLGITSQVHFAGAVNQDAIRRFYDNADAFVLPSFAEGLPVVLMEAMAMGIPCITTSITGVPELIENGDSGLLVPASDVDGLAAAIIRLMDDPALCQRLSERGREKVLTDYVLRVNSGRLGEIFRRRLP